MKEYFRFMVVCFLIVSLAACTAGGPPPEQPGQVQAGETNPPDEGAAESPAESLPTPTFEQGSFSEEQILIAAPGPNSRVVSPFVVEGIAVAPFEALLGVWLTNENGIILAEAYPQVQAQMGQTGPFRQELAFHGIEQETIGRLTVFSASPRDGGLVHVSSVIIRLLPGGESQIGEPVGGPQEKIMISSPANGETVSGSRLNVSGLSEYFFESNLGLMLCGEGGFGGPHLICGDAGSVLAEGNAIINSPDVGIGGEFEGVLQYTVDKQVNARLVVFATSPMDGSIEHLSSVEITLTP